MTTASPIGLLRTRKGSAPDPDDATVAVAQLAPDVDPATRRFASATLNHLANGSPVTDWLDLAGEEEKLVERLTKVAADRARLEVHLLIAGTTREQLADALRARRTTPAITANRES